MKEKLLPGPALGTSNGRLAAGTFHKWLFIT